MSAIISSVILRNLVISQAAAGVTEWWGDLGQTDQYDLSSGSNGTAPAYFYKRSVVRSTGESTVVLSDTADSNPATPTISWLPGNDSPAPTVSAVDLPAGQWLIDTTDVTSDGGVLIIFGPGTQELVFSITQSTTSADLLTAWYQSGNR